MYFNRYDIISAWYWYLGYTHEGQGSKKYERLSKIMTYYSPGRCSAGPDTDNAEAIFLNLCAGDMK